MYLWWQRGIVYQVYPRSFQDSNDDGVGDLRGITARLDYLHWLGVDALWISPIFPSPMKDFGYDVADYVNIDPLFGSLDDFDEMLREAHARNLKVILDFVPNHTSDEHAWFANSRAGRSSAKRDWYIWRDPAPDGGPPNNWLSCFGGSAWEFDEGSGQYYYHAFLPEQPDLNWRNPEVRSAMFEVLRFWLRRGVDGFRVDVLWHLIKDDEFQDNPPNPAWQPGMDPYQSLIPLFTTDRPEVHDIVVQMRAVFDEFNDRVLIGEIYLPLERLVQYYGTELRGVHLPFNFQLIAAQWDAQHIATLVRDYEQALPDGGWPNWVLGNHDQHRIASRVGRAQARVAAMLLLTLRGTPTVYYGDEIGMQDVNIPPDKVHDPFEKNVPGIGLGRDPERTPMQWSRELHAGFSKSEPWLPLAEDADVVNVECERDDAHSMLTLYRRLIELRRGEPALEVGDIMPVDTDGDMLGFVRRTSANANDFLVLLNLSGSPHQFSWPTAGTIAVSTHLDRYGEEVNEVIAVRAHEGVVVRLGRSE